MKTVAVIDDQPIERQVLSRQIDRETGLSARPIEGTYNNIESLIQEIIDADYVLCDHKLTHGHFANFLGAQLVAELYDRGKPAILISQYTSPEYDILLKYREKLPIIVNRDQFRNVDFTHLFENCANELRGRPPPERKLHRVLVEIDSLKDEDHMVAFIPTWRTGKAVILPLSIIPEDLRQETIEKGCLFAQVNIGAENENDLFFVGIESAPDPISEEDMRLSK